MTRIHIGDILDRVRTELKDLGIDLEAGCCDDEREGPVRVFCMSGGLADSLKEMERTTRDQVVMVRIDDETNKKLRHWVETGAFKSRSEAAALFIRQGLAMHARELEELEEALAGVEEAKERLRKKARDVFDQGTESETEVSEAAE